MVGNHTLKILFRMAAKWLTHFIDEAEEAIESRRLELERSDPNLVKDWDHKDWRYKDTVICYWRGFKEAMEEVRAMAGELEEILDEKSG